jgi:HTH-type transcriptional regulator / antitoxin HipB
MDHPIVLTSQLRQHLRSLRKAGGLTQAGLARLLGVGQSRVADIEANPGAVSVEQLLQVLGVLNAQVLIRDTHRISDVTAGLTGAEASVHAGSVSPVRSDGTAQDQGDPPKGQW